MKENSANGRKLPNLCQCHIIWLLQRKALLALVLSIFASLQLFAQARTVTGTVRDDKGQLVAGASVQVKGATGGTTTDANGNFSIQAADNAILQVSFVGYSIQEVEVRGQSTVNVQLSTTAKSMSDVVVVAYGSSTKKTNTGSVQTVSAKELQDIPVAQVTQKLQGKLAGVQINQTSGKPGQGMQVRIRGQASILAGSEPLYVVDGFPIVGDISNINPDEIENISVLKDAASTSLYGSRAANGVVLVTTRRAKAGQSSVGVNAFYGVQQVPQRGRPNMMNAEEFAQFKKESYEDLGRPVPPAFQNPAQYAGKSYDWYGGMLETAPIQNYSINFNAGKDRFSTTAVAGFFNQDGVLKNSNYKRLSLRLNSDFRITDKLRTQFNIAPTYSVNNTPSSDGIFWAGGLLNNAMLTWPVLPYRNEDGSLPLTAWIPGVSAFPAPNWYRSLQEIKNETQTTRLLANAFIEYEPVKGLTLKSSINTDLGQTLFNNFNPSTASIAFASLPPVVASAIKRNNQYYSWLNENLATYRTSVGDHNFDALLGFTTQKFRSDGNQVRLTNFPDDRIQTIQSALNIDRVNSFTDVQEWSLISYVSRLNYNYKGKYLLSAALRRDGSSRFGSDNKWGNFPSLSAGWVVSDEAFMPQVKALSFLKLRASYGIVGNNNIGNYTQYANINNTTNAVFGNTIASGASVVTLSNPNLGWETTKQFDAGVDLGLFGNRVNISYDFYNKRTTNLLYNVAVPQESGFTNFTGNIGEFKFWGHEFTLSSQNMRSGNFKWNTDFNISFNDNKVVALAPGIDRLYGWASITMVGKRIGQFWGLIHDGVYKNQEDFDKSPKHVQSQVGTVKFRDVNGDGVITYGGNNDDRTIIGNPFPKFIYGITNSFAYRNFDLSIVASGSQGNDALVLNEQGTTNLDGVFNVLKEVKDRWRSPQNPGSGKYGKTTAATFMERDFWNTRFVSDASYLAIRNITLGYNVPVKNSQSFRNIRVYGSVQQAAVFTKYRGVNPEVSTSFNGGSGQSVSALELGLDFGSYPVPRTYTVGINVGL